LTPETRVLVVDSDPPDVNARKRKQYGETTGENYVAALAALDASFDYAITCPYAGDALPDLSTFEGAVFTGSAVEWNTDDDRAAPLRAAMRDVFAAGIPSFGSCNGMQLAASVLGGRSDVSPKGREDGLAKNIHLTSAGRSHAMLAGRSDGFAVPCVHRDEVTVLPKGAIVLAGNDHTAVQAMAYAQNGVRFWGVQYHPEYTLPFIGQRVLDWGRMTKDMADDLQKAHVDAGAAARLGVRYQDMQTETRMTELRNWLSSL
jgi:GMP synthase (glutamine-hydrolysing)